MGIMTEEHCNRDVAELLFMDELEALYPDLVGDRDTAETLYELEND